MDKESLTVDGYVFANPKDAELAKNEIKKIAYIENHTDMSNLNTCLLVYKKALEERYFQTPIGQEYMRDLQKAMRNGGIPEEEIEPIPLYTTFARINLSDEPTIKRRVTKAEKKEMSLKVKYRNAVLCAVILGVLVLAMLFITYNGTTPNALNYKQAVINEYSSWEQELTKREKAVREKEKELNIDN